MNNTEAIYYIFILFFDYFKDGVTCSLATEVTTIIYNMYKPTPSNHNHSTFGALIGTVGIDSGRNQWSSFNCKFVDFIDDLPD
jgi:hypothetical protein